MIWHGDYRIVSFFTPDYEEHAARLEASIERYMPAQDYNLVQISQRSWKEATNFKADFCLDQLKDAKKPIVWIDADATICEGGIKFPQADFAIYARFHHPLRRTHAPFMTGTVYFGNTRLGEKLLRAWIDQGEFQKDGIDQWSLFRAWTSLMLDPKDMPSTYWLPERYCRKYDRPGRVSIQHHMASRQTRRKKP